MSDSSDGESIDTVLGGIAKAPPRSPPPVFADGARLGDGRYMIRRLLGRGGMGSVYEAYDEVLAKPVALKILRPLEGAARTAELARVRDEVRLAHEVTHANVCRTFDLEELDGHWIVKMELVAGSTLADHAAGKQLAIAEVVAIARQIASGLRAAHERGVVHRDLKPQNILVEAATGRVVISDFGLARRDEGPADDGAGTPAYMAPEQARGDVIDGRADLYAFGCVVYLMLTGDAVFAADTPTKLVRAHAAGPVPDVRVVRPQTPLWLAQLVKRLLAKDPRQRPSDAELSQILAPRRRRGSVVTAAVAVVAVVAVVALTVAATRHPPPAWRPAIRDVDPEIEEYVTNPTWSPDGTSLAFASNRGGGMRIYVEPIGGVAHAIGPSDRPVWVPHWTRDGSAVLAENYERSPSAPAYRVPLADGAPPQSLGVINWPEDCGDGRIAFVRADPADPSIAQLSVREPDGRERVLDRQNAVIVDVRCDRAGERIVYTLAGGLLSGSLWIASLAGSAPRLIAPNTELGSFHPDGRSVVATVNTADHMNIWEIGTAGDWRRQVTFGTGPDLAPQISPDGRELVYTTGDVMWTDMRLYAYSVPGGAARKLTARVESILDMALSPDGTRLAIHTQERAAGSVRDRVAIVSTVDGSERSLVDGGQPDITPDGREVIYTSGTSVDAIPIDGGAPRHVTTVAGAVHHISIDTDGLAHLSVLAGDSYEAWVAPIRGGPATREARSGWWVIAPRAGAWRLAVQRVGSSFDAHVLAPGMQLSDPHARVLHDVAIDTLGWTLDGDAVTYADARSRFHRLDVATGDDRPIVSFDTEEWTFAQLAADGKTIYVAQGAARTTMHIVTNFGDLPR